MKLHASARGFTLIELLVVITIIGLLATIVLVALGNARQKGGDANIQSNIRTVRSQAEVYANNNGYVYGTQATTTNCSGATTGMFGLDPNIKAAVAAAEAQAGSATLLTTANRSSVCGSGNSFWAVAVVLKSDPSRLTCVDSIGRSKEILVSTIDGAGEPFQGCI